MANIDQAQDEAIREDQERRAREEDAAIRASIERAQEEAIEENLGRSTTAFGAANAAGGMVRDINRSIGTFSSLYTRYRGYLVGTAQERTEAANKNIKEPPKLRYGFLLGAALYVVDPIVIGLSVLSILGAIPSFTGSLVLMAVVGIIIGLLFEVFCYFVVGRKLKNMKKEKKKLQKDLGDIQANLESVKQKYKTLKAWAKNTSWVANNATVQSAFAWAGKKLSFVDDFVKARPALAGVLGKTGTVVRLLAGPAVKIGGKAVPIVNLIPWATLGVIFAYLEHRREHKISKEALEAYQDGVVAMLESEDTNFELQLSVSQAQLEVAMEYAAEQELEAVYYATA